MSSDDLSLRLLDDDDDELPSYEAQQAMKAARRSGVAKPAAKKKKKKKRKKKKRRSPSRADQPLMLADEAPLALADEEPIELAPAHAETVDLAPVDLREEELELERARLELEKQKLELERQKLQASSGSHGALPVQPKQLAIGGGVLGLLLLIGLAAAFSGDDPEPLRVSYDEHTDLPADSGEAPGATDPGTPARPPADAAPAGTSGATDPQQPRAAPADEARSDPELKKLRARVVAARRKAEDAERPAELGEVEAELDAIGRHPSADEDVKQAIVEARGTLSDARRDLRKTLGDAAARAEQAGRYQECLDLLHQLSQVDPQVGAQMKLMKQRCEEALAEEAAAAEAEAARLKAEEEAAVAAEAAAAEAADKARVRAIAKIKRGVEDRAKSWFRKRSPKTLACDVCDGSLEQRCPHDTCRGKGHIRCPGCGGQDYVWMASGTRRIKKDCDNCPPHHYHGHVCRKNPNCPPSGRVWCPTCSRKGKVRCRKCSDGPDSVPGYRGVKAADAFWKFVSDATRRGRERTGFFGDIHRNKRRVMGDAIGDDYGIKSARIGSVEVEKDQAVVTARVVWANGSKGEYVTRWIREGGKYYVRTPADTKPEVLLEDE